MALTITPPPVKLFTAKVQVFTEGMLRAAAGALREEHELGMAEAKRRTPVDTGTLRASGTVFPTEVSGSTLVSRGGFGGAAAGYAVIVHENLTARHPSGQAKFYESALLDRARGAGARLAAGIRRRMGGR